MEGLYMEYKFKSRISLISVRVTVLRLPLETAIFVMRIPILFQISKPTYEKQPYKSCYTVVTHAL